MPQRGVARAARHRRGRPARPTALDRPRRHHLVRGPAVRPLRVLRRPGEDRGRLARRQLHGPRRRSARRRRLPLPRGPAARPDHHRRGERLPAQVENALREHPGVDDVAVYALPTSAGASGSARPWSARRARRKPRLRARTARAPQEAQEYHHLDDLPRTLTGNTSRPAHRILTVRARTTLENTCSATADPFAACRRKA